MIDEKLVYAQAILDSIEVTDDELNKELITRSIYFINQYGSKEKVEQIYGMSLERIKRELRDDVRKNVNDSETQGKEIRGR